MANEGIRPLIINFLWIGLFFVALVTGGVIMSVQNGSSNSILNNSLFANASNSFSGNLTDYYQTTSDSEKSFENSTVTLTGGIPFIDSIYGTWKILKSVPMIMYTLVVDVVMGTLLGSQTTTIIVSVITSILIITLIFAIVKLISSGDGG